MNTPVVNEADQLEQNVRNAIAEFVGYLRDIENVSPANIRIEIEDILEEELMK